MVGSSRRLRPWGCIRSGETARDIVLVVAARLSLTMSTPGEHGETRFSPREAAEAVALRLRQAGYQALFAGGCVRDELLGLTPKDYDVATNATPPEIQRLFPRAHGVGAAFGVVLVRIGGQSVEVTTFRADGAYSDSRRPDQVSYADAPQDARRRDFTINGLYEDPETGEIIDYVEGLADLEAGVIRAIGDPAARLREDHLRALRAVRFAARFRFRLDPRTAEAIRRAASDLRGVSRERIGQEVTWMMALPARAEAATLVQSLELDAAVLEEPHWEGPLPRLAGLRGTAGTDESVPLPTALAAWWLDRRSGGAAIASDAEGWRKALMLSNDDWHGMQDALRGVEAIGASWMALPVAARKRLASSPAYALGLPIVKATEPQRAASVEQDVAELARTGLAPPPLVTGDDLIAAGFQPGPAFRHVLWNVYDAQLEGRVIDRPGGLAMARQLLEQYDSQREGKRRARPEKRSHPG